MRKEEIIKLILLSILVIISVTIGIFISIYKYKDCLKVGHSETYCMLSFGR